MAHQADADDVRRPGGVLDRARLGHRRADQDLDPDRHAAPLADLDAGDVVIGGVAWAQERGGIAKVQVQIDGGAWQDANLGPDGGNDYWRQWFYRWDAETGSHRIAARAVSGDGEEQTAARAEPFPDGASGLHEPRQRRLTANSTHPFPATTPNHFITTTNGRHLP